jgi:hypothetical protein
MNNPGSIFPGEGRARIESYWGCFLEMHEARPLTNLRVVKYRKSEFVGLEMKNQ